VTGWFDLLVVALLLLWHAVEAVRKRQPPPS